MDQWRTVPSPGDSAPPQMSVVVEGQPKRSFAIDPVTKLDIEFPLSTLELRLLRVATSCESATIPGEKCSPLGTDEILGYRVQKATIVAVNRPKTVHETYLAPDLNFISLMRHVNNGERVTYRQIAISVVRKEPDDTVFAIPADYGKVSEMSEFYTAGETGPWTLTSINMTHTRSSRSRTPSRNKMPSRPSVDMDWRAFLRTSGLARNAMPSPAMLSIGRSLAPSPTAITCSNMRFSASAICRKYSAFFVPSTISLATSPVATPPRMSSSLA